MAWVLKNGQRIEVPDADVFGPAPTLAENKFAKLSALADRRWQAETGGFNFNGMHVASDDRSKSLINGAKDLAAREPNEPIMFKVDGQFVSLDAPTMDAIALALGQHVRACFAHEATLSAQINVATTQAELDAVDINAGWPG